MGRGATFTKPNTFSTGQTSDPAAVNSNFDTILNNLDPSGIGSYFANTTEMQAASNPAPGGTPSIPTNLLGWVQQVHYQFSQITGNSYWYQAANNLTGITLTTPVLASFYQDAAKTKLMTVPAAASDTLALLGATQILTNKSLTAPTIGDFTNANHNHSNAINGGNISSSGIAGTTAGGDAAAGIVGEIISSVLPSTSAVVLANSVTKTVTSISLTAGDWDVEVIADYSTGVTSSLTYSQQGSSTVTNTFGGQDTAVNNYINVSASSTFIALGPTVRYSLAVPTVIYLVVNATFTGTCSAYGTIRARRVR